MNGHRGFGVCPVIRLVLGFGGAVSFFAGDHPSAGVSSTNRWFWWRWDRRRRASDLRSLLLRRHVVVADEVDEAGEVDEECARVSTGSGSHNLDAPYLARQRCRGKLSSHEHLWDRSPFYVAVRERREHGEQIEGHTRAVLPRFGPRGCVKLYSCLGCIEFLGSGA